MKTIDHIILKVNELEPSIAFYRDILGFAHEGTDGPFTLMRVNDSFQLQLAPYGTPGFEHYAFALSADEFEQVLGRLKAAGIPTGPSFNTVGKADGIGRESGAKGMGPTVYFNDPNNHLLEIRTYEPS